MAKARKKTSREKVIEAALFAAPAPVRAIASNPIGFRLLVVAAAGLMATGILTLDWRDGVPHFNFNREKAREVRQEVVADVEQHLNQWEQQHGIPPSYNGQSGYPDQGPQAFQNGTGGQVPPGYFIQTGPANPGAANNGAYQNTYPQYSNQPNYPSTAQGYPQGWGQPPAPPSTYYNPGQNNYQAQGQPAPGYAPGYPPGGYQQR